MLHYTRAQASEFESGDPCPAQLRRSQHGWICPLQALGSIFL